MKKIILTIVFAITAMVAMNAQNKITVEVTGITNPTGDLYIALYDSESPFLSIKAIEGKIIKIDTETLNVTFDVPKDGYYALAIFQDENKNGKLDLGEMGIPMEKYAFSNDVDPAALKRQPEFDECKFEVKGDTQTTVKMTSAIK
jgi:uncharacterized protein (DUF2141 family)